MTNHPWTDADMAALSRRLSEAAEMFHSDSDPGKRALVAVYRCIDAMVLSRHPVLPGSSLRGSDARVMADSEEGTE